MNAFDYFVIAILILSAVSGFNKGFLNAVGKIVGLIAGILLAVTYYETLASYLQEYYGLVTALSEVIRSKIPITVLNMESAMLINGMNFDDAAHYLAYLLIIAVSFLAIFLLSSKVIQMLWSGLDSLFSWGWLSSINRMLGMTLEVVKNLIILTIILGLIHPALTLASGMGFYTILLAADTLDKSITASYMLQTYSMLKDLAGIKT
ncbi:putative membrane protein [hydrocarbon metagenome]|uniref:Putative membrane protein n=1 Tax=hydrocarbon metagenome TaxID=938273 RepID=A0A0W8E7E1_9ZZZZ